MLKEFINTRPALQEMLNLGCSSNQNKRVLINTVKTYEWVKFTGNGKYILKVKFPNIVMVVHNSLITPV